MQRERLSEPTSCNKGDAIVWSLWKHREVGGTETTYPLSKFSTIVTINVTYNGQPFAVDKYAPNGTLYGLDLSCWSLYHIEDWDWLNTYASIA